MTKRIDAADREGLKAAAQALRFGEVVAFPTETVYGLGANALDASAVLKIYKAKERPSDNPLIIHVNTQERASRYAEVNEQARKLFDAFSPGPITVIMRKKEGIPDIVTAGLDSIAVRIPGNETAQALIGLADIPVAAPSANRSGRPSPTEAESVMQDMDGRIWGVVDGGNCRVGIESTIVDVTGRNPIILRPGGITLEQIRKVLPDCEMDQGLLQKPAVDLKPKAPGMKYKHYAPRAQVIVYEGNTESVRLAIQTYITEHPNQKIGVFAKNHSSYDRALVLNWGSCAEEMANLLFAALRQFDRENVDVILCEPAETGGMGTSVRNRLYKAAGFHIIHADA